MAVCKHYTNTSLEGCPFCRAEKERVDRSESEVNVEAMVKPDNGDQIPKPEWKTLLTWLVDKIAIEDKPKLSKGSAVTMIKYLEDLISKC